MRHGSIQSVWPLTPMVKRLMIANFAIWLLTVISIRMGYTFLYEKTALTPALVYHEYHIWQLFTYMWLHSFSDYLHILLNLLFLWMFGGTLEASWGAKSFLKFYLVCGIGAGIVVFITGLLFYPSIPTVGASGAIYGLVAAWALTYPDRNIYLFAIIPIKGKYFALFPIGVALLDFIVGGTGISHAAHLGGLAIGALLVTGLWRPGRLKNRIRYLILKKKLKSIDGGRKPPRGNRWN